MGNHKHHEDAEHMQSLWEHSGYLSEALFNVGKVSSEDQSVAWLSEIHAQFPESILSCIRESFKGLNFAAVARVAKGSESLSSLCPAKRDRNSPRYPIGGKENQSSAAGVAPNPELNGNAAVVDAARPGRPDACLSPIPRRSVLTNPMLIITVGTSGNFINFQDAKWERAWGVTGTWKPSESSAPIPKALAERLPDGDGRPPCHNSSYYPSVSSSRAHWALKMTHRPRRCTIEYF
ncbi:hypothetical protein FB45DRAFT_874436 [Roridomyces roridus]|uniref:Uncharacterized protein n=1 Tax=Roridomyces roridus TaxID=1738132 RepID=A0AAD7B8T1_9AGAR|nr:hypothetical protein FB45DRAFT_874436 [Roridomyces roridus]